MSERPLDLLKDLTKKEMIELDACTRCNECIQWCPVQEVINDPTLSPPARIHSYRGFLERSQTLSEKLSSLNEVSEEELKSYKDSLYHCVLCGTCGEVCTVGIDTKKLWWSLRRKIAESPVGCPEPLKVGAVGNYLKYRSPFPFPLTHRYRIWMPDDVKVADKAEIGYYEGCGCTWDAPQMAEGAVRLLSSVGPFTMLGPEESWCCGFPQVTAGGEWSVMVELVNHMVEAITNKGIKRVVVSCPMCLDIIKYLWPYFYGDRLPFECLMITEILSEWAEEGRLKFKKRIEETVTYHDPCAMARPLLGTPITEPPRSLLRKVPGLDLVDMGRHGKLSRCCGGSAGMRALHSDISANIAKNLFLEGKRTGASAILTSCPVCYLNLGPRTHVAPNPTTEQWRKHNDSLRVNDICQYLAGLL